MSNEAPLLQLENISREFPSAENGEPLRVLHELSLEIGCGESIAIVGPSGCGKSTLLNIIGTLDQPTTGKVTLDGQDLNTLDGNALAALRNRVAQQQNVVQAYKMRSARMAALMRSMRYAGGAPVGAGSALGGAGAGLGAPHAPMSFHAPYGPALDGSSPRVHHLLS